MNKFNSNEKIGEMVIKFPSVTDIFKKYKIDYCCGGDRPLITAITEQNIDETELLNQINKAYEKHKDNSNSEEKEWLVEPLDDLVDHIVNTHHAYLYKNLPLISDLITKTLRAHGVVHPELVKIHKLFNALKTELEEHLIKEETVQYPAIKEYSLDKTVTSLDKAISVCGELEDEHIVAGDVLKQLRTLTNDYSVPADGCSTYEVAYSKLQELESDIFNHIHLENNILFPRLIKLKD